MPPQHKWATFNIDVHIVTRWVAKIAPARDKGFPWHAQRDVLTPNQHRATTRQLKARQPPTSFMSVSGYLMLNRQRGTTRLRSKVKRLNLCSNQRV